MLGKAVGRGWQCRARRGLVCLVALGSACGVILSAAAAAVRIPAPAPGITIEGILHDPARFTLSLTNTMPTGSPPINAMTLQLNGGIVSGFTLDGYPPFKPTGVQDAFFGFPLSIPVGTTVGGSGQIEGKLAAGNVFKVCTSTDSLASASCQDVGFKAAVKIAGLSVKKTLTRSRYDARPITDVLAGDDGAFVITVENKGPDATTFAVTDQLPQGLELTEPSFLTDQGCSGPAKGPLTCTAALAPGRTHTFVVDVTFTTARLYQDNAATVRSTDGAVDPNPADNAAKWFYNVYPGLTSRIKAFDETKGFQPKPPSEDLVGDAGERQEVGYRLPGARPPAASPALGKLAFVDVAVLSLRTAPGASRTCRWLANSRAQFRSIPARNGLCSTAIWLRATGTRHWRYALEKRLPPGRYIAYSRAGNKANAVQNVFSVKLGNRLDFVAR